MLTIARHGSVAKACVALGMTHSTLLRRLDLVESRLKTRLFDRVRGRYTLTQAGEQIVDAASAFEPVALAAETRVRGQDLRPRGNVRVAAASIVIEHLLPGVLVQFASSFPEVRIELTASREHVSLSRREADVAIRVADRIPIGWSDGNLPTCGSRSTAGGKVERRRRCTASRIWSHSSAGSASSEMPGSSSSTAGLPHAYLMLAWHCGSTTSAMRSPWSRPVSASPCCPPSWSPVCPNSGP
ncbi:MAG: LysR family transcriptional regulator [Sterolibacteriaceae bacterium]|uniref:LysR family transcriptional regulator n=1 Tax=Candidatus Methylophosphatis roskildensis TaxID=2899263 RepID=A0A9D7EC06_9PROT|nr:LysR family transcriptional regulator [Candidatus Methylophosphatis roskildensis]